MISKQDRSKVKIGAIVKYNNYWAKEQLGGVITGIWENVIHIVPFDDCHSKMDVIFWETYKKHWDVVE